MVNPGWRQFLLVGAPRPSRPRSRAAGETINGRDLDDRRESDDRTLPRTSFCSRLFSFFLPFAPAANAARTLDWTLMTRSRSTWTLRPRLRPLHTGLSRPAAAASLWYSCAGATRSHVRARRRAPVACLEARRHERGGELGGGDGRDADLDAADLDLATVLAVLLLDVVVQVRAVKQRRRDDRATGLEHGRGRVHGQRLAPRDDVVGGRGLRGNEVRSRTVDGIRRRGRAACGDA